MKMKSYNVRLITNNDETITSLR